MEQRRVNFTKVPFNHHRGRNAVVTVRELGETLVDEDIAEAAVAKGHAEDLESKATKPRGSGKKAADAATDTGHADGVDRADLAPADSADGGDTVAVAE